MTNYESLLISEDHFIDFDAPATYKNVVVKATMREIGAVLLAIWEEVESSDTEHAIERLRELYLHNHTLSGEFKFDVFNYGAWIIRKIKQYKPLPQKKEEHFVVEM